MNLRHGMVATLAAASVVLAACGGDDNNNGPSGTQLSAAESAALSGAIVNSGAISGEASLVAPLAFGLVKGYGTITPTAAARTAATRLASLASSYNAVGYQVKYDFTVNGVQQVITSTGAVAWAGLNTQAQTVDELVFVAGYSEDPTFPTQSSGTIGTDVEATWAFHDPQEVYVGTAGSAELTAASFSGGTTDCSQNIPGFGTINCAYRYGNMQGSFGFDAQLLGGTTTKSFPSASYDLPAVQVVLSANVTIPGGVVRANEFFGALRNQLGQH